MFAPQTTEPPVKLSDSAALRINAIVDEMKSEKNMLRVAVDGGGCSGFQYSFDLEDTKNPDDVVVENQGATLLVDSVSLLYLAGAEIDYVSDLIGASFQIKNPNATASCSCGSSFSV
ncbi:MULTISPECIES: iron-sulfur cluster insertion protein ErpA [Sneathiella]|jgi:iron-sulfur cluster insertion protein|uniref:iron-sulfur cluster insertion protein ErpA n=1 Tax=Sneathiella TaxID=510690 RepID=UPI00146F3832|nr:iron-sulfur cluster insertion protein ErpA [Sneathiella aquimaris]